MKLIIVVVIAGAVLAAVLAMLNSVSPPGDLSVSFRDGTNFYDAGISGSSGAMVESFTVEVVVTDADSGEPVEGATVTITGYSGGGASNPTDGSGVTSITVNNVEMPANTNQIKLDVEVSAGGYHTLTLEDAITVVR
ncbi:MAG: hypothetical protein PHU95_06630 [Candidatus Thermoplasmatota archaeon]|nr:hypothetical protein [Candidatus Thermoplasmatota archaeon]